MLAQIFLGDEAHEGQERFARLQRRSADAETAARLLEFVYSVDVSADVPRIEVPAVVVHRRSDRAVPYALGRQLAAALPDATFAPLAGTRASALVRGSRRGGASLPSRVGRAGRLEAAEGEAVLLSEREREVLALVARGLTDREISEQLVISPHTVHRHVANVRQKLGSTSRSAAVAEAARLGLL